MFNAVDVRVVIVELFEYDDDKSIEDPLKLKPIFAAEVDVLLASNVTLEMLKT